MTVLTSSDAARLTAALHENSIEAAKLRAAYRASLPQVLDLDALCFRYALDAKQVRALIESRGIAFRAFGRGIRVHIDEVLRLDAMVRKDVA